MDAKSIICSALNQQPENLQIELQAEQVPEYEKEYLEANLMSRIQTRNPSINNFTTKSNTQVDTRRNFEPLISSDESKMSPKGKTGSNLMKFFHIKRFVQRIRLNRTKLSNLNENHIKLIHDNSSDSQAMMSMLKFNNQSTFRIRNVSRLFRDNTITPQENKYTVFIREKYLLYQKQFYEFTSKIPQIHPETPRKIAWDYWTLFFRLLLLILIPLEIAYTPGILFDQSTGLTIVATLVLILDCLVRFNTICYQNGHAVFDRWKIIHININLQFGSDIAIILLLLYFLHVNGNQFQYIILLISLTQHNYINQVMQKSEESSYFTKKQKAFISLFKLLTTLIYVLHLFSCIWFFNSTLSICNTNSWIIFKELDHQQWQLQYLEAFYFAIVTMLTIGYGDNVPRTWNEKIISIFFIMSACLWFSYSINKIGLIIKDINLNSTERSKKIRVINRYMHQRKIPFSLQYKIREYLNFRWKEEAEIDLQEEEILLNELSEELKQDLKKQANNVFFQHCEFLFKNFSLELQNSLSLHIRRKIIQPQNKFSIYTLSEVRQPHLCFVEQGQLQYQHPLKVAVKSVQNQGQFVQVQEFIQESDRPQIFKAIGYVSLLILSKVLNYYTQTDFLSVIKQYPKDYQKFCNLKDSIIFQVRTRPLPYGSYCPACDNNAHNLKECSNLSLSIDKELIIKRHQFSQEQQRIGYFQRSKRRGKSFFSTRCDREIIEQFAIYFQNEKPKLVTNQLSKQLIYEQEFEDDDLNDPSPINKTFLFKQQNSIAIIPRHSIQSGESNLKVQMADDSIISSVNNSIQNLKLSTRQQCMLTANKFMTAKLSQYKRMLHQQPPKIALIDSSQSIKIDLQEGIQQGIDMLYHKIFDLDINANKLDESVQNLEMLYYQLKAQQGIDQFEVVKNFNYYMTDHNIQSIILAQQQKSQSLFLKPITQLLKYMYFPYEFIMKFQKIKTQKLRLLNFYQKRSFKNLKKKGTQIGELVRKWGTPRKSYRFSVVLPNNQE